MARSKIEWCDETWNPVFGCTKVSPGCAKCYAERIARRFAGRPGFGPVDNPFKVTLYPDRLEQPLYWRKRRMVFVCSMSDLFHKDVPSGFIRQVWGVMTNSQRHTFLVLTKRSQRMLRWYTRLWCRNRLPNVWLGVSAENQKRLDERLPHLLQCPATARFLSCEPLLGPIDLESYLWDQEAEDRFYNVQYDRIRWPDHFRLIDWVIVGAESGPGARPMDLGWARDIRDQCADVGVPFFLKQICKNGRKIPFEEWPTDLKVRQMPEVTTSS